MVISGDTPYTSATTFIDLSLSKELLKGLFLEMEFRKPSKIQAISLPMILEPPHKDLIAQAPNGSGKTTCFVLEMLSRVDPNLHAPQALCICPTRELAIQNNEVLQKMGKYTGISSQLAIPRMDKNSTPLSIRPPIMSQVVIGTPGTIKNCMMYKKLEMTRLKILVYDEADQFAEDGFRDYSMRLIEKTKKLNSNCQVLLFSATLNDTVKNFVTKIVLKEHNEIFVKKEELSLDAVKQYKVHCPNELAKIEVIKDYIFKIGENVGKTIMFVRTTNSAKMLHKALVDLGYEVSSILDALEPEERDKMVKEFKDGLTRVLISNDVLARGFDQDQVNLVINYDLPLNYTLSSPVEVNLSLIVMCIFTGLVGPGNLGARVRQKSVEDYKDAFKKAGLLY